MGHQNCQAAKENARRCKKGKQTDRLTDTRIDDTQWQILQRWQHKYECVILNKLSRCTLRWAAAMLTYL